MASAAAAPAPVPGVHPRYVPERGRVLKGMLGALVGCFRPAKTQPLPRVLALPTKPQPQSVTLQASCVRHEHESRRWARQRLRRRWAQQGRAAAGSPPALRPQARLGAEGDRPRRSPLLRRCLHGEHRWPPRAPGAGGGRRRRAGAHILARSDLLSGPSVSCLSGTCKRGTPI
ncbi:hypothetical protein HU200_017465 [Digitaria exilis]|uniref:Uncharacterized protein n=1 Tax=Digitaria exilis TaxID=1010633 RepID=A0A835F668_9POAL|nr:hypothetical protein HU200_017465 [Digitaria exilis]